MSETTDGTEATGTVARAGPGTPAKPAAASAGPGTPAKPAIEPSPEPGVEPPATRLGRDRWWWTEHVAVALLAITSVLTAWSAYQSTRWSGEMAQAYSSANALRSESVRTSTRAGQLVIIDVQSFVAWTEAVAGRDPALAIFLRTRFRPEFLAAFDAWLGRPPGTTVSVDQIPPGSPFDGYQPAGVAAADDLAAQADAAGEEARGDNQRGDNYILTTVLLATVLFFAGIAPRFRTGRLAGVLIGLAGVMLVIGVAALALQPISFGV